MKENLEPLPIGKETAGKIHMQSILLPGQTVCVYSLSPTNANVSNHYRVRI